MTGRPTAMVTGASRGIGRACALALAAAGYDVAVTARTVTEGTSVEGLPGSLASTTAEIEALGAKALAVPLDLLDRDALGPAVEAVLGGFGYLDVLVNNAIYVGTGNDERFLDVDMADVEKRINANLTAQLILSQRALKAMVERGGGTIVNITSGAGMVSPPGPIGEGGWALSYAVSKGGLHRAAGVLAAELGPQGIRAYNLQPGFVATERTVAQPQLSWIANQGNPPELIGRVLVWLLTAAPGTVRNGKTIHATDVGARSRLVARGCDGRRGHPPPSGREIRRNQQMASEPVFNLADLFEVVVDAVPDREALVAGDVRLTFRQLDERANRLAHVLQAAGVSPGDKVAVYAWNRAEWVEAWWAAYKARAVPINVNYRYTGEELHYLLDNCDAKAIVHEAEFTPVLEELLPRLPQVELTLEMGEAYEKALAEQSPDRDFGPRSPDDIYMLYTGGTTGMPKGVMWRHEDIFMAAMGGNGLGIADPIEKPADCAARAVANNGFFRNLVLPPLMHGAAQWGSCNAIGGAFAGGTMILQTTHGFDPKAAWELAEREKVTGVAVVGDAMARPLVEALDERSYALDSLISFGSGGAILSPVVKARLKEHFPNLAISDSYGASETGAGGSPAEGEGTSPRFRLSEEVTILDEELKPVVPGSGIIGRLARRGHIPLGYYKDEVKTAATFVTAGDGVRYVIPGDFATVEEDGTIILLGRGSQCINTGGEKVYPEEVEAVLKEHPGVYDALVVGVPDERFGERIAAVVQAREGAAPTLEDLQGVCTSKLARYKMPRELVLVDEMPRSPAGKADYRRAKALATGT